MTTAIRSLAATLLCLAAAGCADGGPGVPSPFDGVYNGEAQITDPAIPALACTPRIPMANFRVVNGRVEFGQFSGDIAPNGYVQMVSREFWISGNFSLSAPDAVAAPTVAAPVRGSATGMFVPGQFQGTMERGPVCHWNILLYRA